MPSTRNPEGNHALTGNNQNKGDTVSIHTLQHAIDLYTMKATLCGTVDSMHKPYNSQRLERIRKSLVERIEDSLPDVQDRYEPDIMQ